MGIHQNYTLRGHKYDLMLDVKSYEPEGMSTATYTMRHMKHLFLQSRTWRLRFLNLWSLNDGKVNGALRPIPRPEMFSCGRAL